jgi:tetratricopeptide (TPR) repeat protein
MSRMLNMAGRLLAMGRHFQALGRDHDALQTFARLASLRDLPGVVAEETQARLGELCLHGKQFRRARRHLTAALTHAPDSARYHYLLATAADGDDRPNPERAAEHFRKSLELDPNQPRCLGEYGLLALRLGRIDEGLDCLRRGAELAPDDPDAVGRLVTGLQELDEDDEARQVVRAALFRNTRDPRFRRLWDDFQFQRLHDEQAAARRGVAASGRAADGPDVLPFVRPEPSPTAPPRQRTIRRDRPSAPAGPHLPRPLHVPDKKHA